MLVLSDTLLWGMIGVVIAGVIIAITPIFTGRTICTKDGDARATMSNIKSQLANFEIEFDRYPTTAEGIDALVHAPPALPSWNHPFLDKLPIDPWGNLYKYTGPAPGSDTYGLHSLGPDGKDGTADDIRF